MTPIYVQLGKIGDILNVLPFLRKDALTGEKPRLMVADQFAPLLEGVSYVEPVIYPGPHHEIGKAVALARTMSDRVICTQVNGPQDQVREFTFRAAGQEHAVATSFQKESWKVAGRLREWDECLPLVFDRRNPEREEKLLREVGLIRKGKKKPLILMALNGESSPFQHAQLLNLLVNGWFGQKCEIRSIPPAERFFDLLGLYERADLLIAVDSAPLHLAWACPELPVIALTQDSPMLWHGSPWRPNHAWYCRYGDFVDRAVDIVSELDMILDPPVTPPMIRIVVEYEVRAHAYSGIKTLAIAKGMCSRDSAVVMNAKRRVPYLRDVLRMALQKTRKEPDNFPIQLVRPQCLADCNVATPMPYYAYRIQNLKFQPVVDLFCATRAQWLAMLPEVPDLILGGDYQWSQALWAIFKGHGATEAFGICEFYSKSNPQPQTNPSITLDHNSKLCAEVMLRSKVHSRYPKVSEQLPTKWVQSPLLPPFQYNPSIIRLQGKLWMTYRHHPDPANPITRLGLAQLNDDGGVISAIPLNIDGPAQEDGRLFSYHGELWLSWVESIWDKKPVRTVLKHGKIVLPFDETGKPVGTIDRVFQPNLGTNDGTSTQKNWVFWEWDWRELVAIYISTPHHTVARFRGDIVAQEYKSEKATWPYGEIRGGCVLPYNGKLLRFFHSHLNNDHGPVPHRYFIGAMLMNPNPPFEVISVSRKPILYGSEVDDLAPDVRKTVPFRNGNVVFPCGAATLKDGWLLAVGVNHSQCCLVTVTERDLNL